MIRIGKTGTIRLTGKDLTALRETCFKRDRYRCRDCGRSVSEFVPEAWPQRAHMAHILGRGAGGGDVIDNVRTLCARCHGSEHSPKAVASPPERMRPSERK